MDAAQQSAEEALPRWRRAFSALATLSIATFGGAGASFLSSVLLARELGPTSYGLFASSLATVSIVAPFAGFGLAQFWLRAYGVEGWRAARWLRPSIRIVGVTTTLSLAALLFWALFGAGDAATRFSLLGLSPVVLGVLGTELASSKLRLEERYRALALWQLGTPGSRLVLVLFLVAVPTLGWAFAVVGYGLVSLAMAALALPQLRVMARGDFALRGHGAAPIEIAGSSQPSAMELWSGAWAYGLLAALYPVFFQVGTVLLKYLGSDADAGMFGIAVAVLAAIYLLPATVYQKYLLSKLHRWASHDQARFQTVYRQGIILMFAAGIGVGGLLALIAPVVVPVVFGVAYSDVARILSLMAICVPVRFLASAVGSALLNEQQMRFRVLAMGIATAAAACLNIIFIPRLGVTGAALSTLAAEVVLLALLYAGARYTNAAPRRPASGVAR
ncbi:lipopolysaccharide biosynthesis protein [Vulgatibacter sp.]|uniref:lipopolysaccharide biosynthesis protein n=1 Tax=Vulgatibacter sp. TaxID=1971226 RepID=UPI00356552DC